MSSSFLYHRTWQTPVQRFVGQGKQPKWRITICSLQQNQNLTRISHISDLINWINAVTVLINTFWLSDMSLSNPFSPPLILPRQHTVESPPALGSGSSSDPSDFSITGVTSGGPAQSHSGSGGSCSQIPPGKGQERCQSSKVWPKPPRMGLQWLQYHSNQQSRSSFSSTLNHRTSLVSKFLQLPWQMRAQ